MKKKLYGFAVLALLLMLPFSALAMSHEKKKMDHGAMEGMDHGKMMEDGDMMMLGDQVSEGVKASAHLRDVKDAMAKMSMSETHHFMVMFMNTETGDKVEEGMAAVKIEGPNGYQAGPIELMGMQGHFGVDIELPEKGKYRFQVGTRLADGNKRQYEFTFDYK